MFQAGNALGKGSSYQINRHFIALCAVYALVPIAILRAIQRRPGFSRRLYSIVLNVLALLALLAVVGGIAFSLIPFQVPKLENDDVALTRRLQTRRGRPAICHTHAYIVFLISSAFARCCSTCVLVSVRCCLTGSVDATVIICVSISCSASLCPAIIASM